MSLDEVLAELREELALVDRAIAALQALAQSEKRGPGRPPGSGRHRTHDGLSGEMLPEKPGDPPPGPG